VGIRDRFRSAGKKAVSRALDEVTKRLYGEERHWTEEDRALGKVPSGSSRTATDEADRLAKDVGYQVNPSDDPASEITRPRAGRIFGARFDHYPILAPAGALPPKGSAKAWDLNQALHAPLQTGIADFKETLLLALTATECRDSAQMEDQLLELHPVLEPQTIVVFARLGNLEMERLYRRVTLGDTTLTLPAIPIAFVFQVEPSGKLTYKSLAQRELNQNGTRFGILPLLQGETYLPEGIDGTLEFQRGKSQHRTTASKGYSRAWSVTIPGLEGPSGG